jgi:hypothetical protein
VNGGDTTPRRPVTIRARLLVDLTGRTGQSDWHQMSRRIRMAASDARPGAEIVLRVPAGPQIPVLDLSYLREHGQHSAITVEAPDTATGEQWIHALQGSWWEVS